MQRLIVIYFSPTHTSKKVLMNIAEGMGEYEILEIDLTKDIEINTDLNIELNIELKNDDLILMGAPVYGGRVPSIAYERLNKLKGNGQAAVCVSVFGNHGYSNALIQLYDMLKNNGFTVIAGAAFIGEHSFSVGKTKVAEGRPNKADAMEAKAFGNKVREKLEKTNDLKSLEILTIPGKVPKGDLPNFPKVGSKTNKKCVECGNCITVCPVDAIDSNLKCNSHICIHCFACVKLCPYDARELRHPIFSLLNFYLSKEKEKHPETFI